MLYLSRFFLFLLVALTALPAIAADDCDRTPRKLEYTNKIKNIYVSPGQWAEIEFPENLFGMQPEKTEGFVHRSSPAKNKLRVSTTSSSYSSNLIVHADNGETFLVRLVARKGCADSLVSVVYPEIQDLSKSSKQNNSRTGKKKSLMEYMLREETPSGYRKIEAKGTREDRLVFSDGSLRFYVLEYIAGPRFVGTILLVENTGRTAYRVDLEGIDYSSKELRDTFGRIREITMYPFSLRLGPSPEHISDVYAASHEGLIYIVSERDDEVHDGL